MPERVIQTGVTLRRETQNPTRGKALEFSAQVWVEIERDGVRSRHGGQGARDEFILGEDATTPLIRLALSLRETNLGSAVGDARRDGARSALTRALFRRATSAGLEPP